MKKIIWFALIALAITAFLPAAAQKEKSSVTVWTWESKENQKRIIEAFNQEHPEIAIEFSNVADVDMAKKLQTALASGSDLPDAVWMEISFRGKLISLDCWEDLSKHGIDKKNILEFLLPLSTNSKGELMGLEVSPAITGLAYKRDLAKQYFGTDDPAQLAKMMPDWASMIRLGKEVKAKSGGKAFLFSGIDQLYQIVGMQNADPYVVDGRLNIEKQIRSSLAVCIEFAKEGLIDKMDSFTAAWNDAIRGPSVIFFPCATWGPTWVIKANDPDSTERWGLMSPPQGPMMWGGTIVGVPKKAKNKEAAITFLKWCYMSENGARANRDSLEYFTPMKSVYADPSFYSNPDPYFGNQDVLKYFAQDLRQNMVPSRPVTQYDTEVNESISLALADISASTDGNLSLDALVKKVIDSVREKVPELK